MKKLLSTVIEEFFANNNLADRSRRKYKDILTRYFQHVEVFNLKSLKDVDYPVLRNETVVFISQYQSANSKKLAAACLRSFYGYLTDLYPIIRNPVPSTRSLNLPPQNKSNTPSATFGELQGILAALGAKKCVGYVDHLRYVLVLVLSSTSLRISEALQITVEMVAEGVLDVIQKRDRRRRIALPTEVRREVLLFIARFGLSGYLFQASTGNRLTRHLAYYHIKKSTGYCCHSFRKSMIEILIQRGVHSHEVAKVSGHASINMVYYYDSRNNEPEAHKGLAAELLS